MTLIFSTLYPRSLAVFRMYSRCELELEMAVILQLGYFFAKCNVRDPHPQPIVVVVVVRNHQSKQKSNGEEDNEMG